MLSSSMMHIKQLTCALPAAQQGLLALAANASAQRFACSTAALPWMQYLPAKVQGIIKRARSSSNYPPRKYQPGRVSELRPVPEHITRPDYVNNRKSRSAPSVTSLPEVHSDEESQAGMRAAGQLAARALQLAGRLVQPGVTTDDLDAAVHQYCIEHDAYPSPLLYHGYPKSICTSVNEVVCHGIPDSRPLQEGDIVNIDVTVYLGGFHGDTNATFLVGDPPAAVRDLVEVTRRAQGAAMQLCGPDVPFSAIGACIQKIADAEGMSIVRRFVGHGIGRVFHAAPAVLHHRNWRLGRMQLHQTFTIEPILTLGAHWHRTLPDSWTAVTVDGSYTAQFEHTVMVTDNGIEVLTGTDKGQQ